MRPTCAPAAQAPPSFPNAFKKLRAAETAVVAMVRMRGFEQRKAERPPPSGHEREVPARSATPTIERLSSASSAGKSAGGSGSFVNWEAPPEIPRSPAKHGRRS
jgi:hypothetical protein